LGSFDFVGDRAFEPITHFSGGEKARLALAIIAWQKPNVLLLDEPTNHLDLEMRQALTMALQDFGGAIIVVSHDRHLLRNTVDQFLLVADGTVSEFDGELEDYYRWLSLQKQAPANTKPVAAAKVIEPKQDKKASRQQTAAQRQELKPLTNKLKSLEAQMEKLQARLQAIETSLGAADIYDEENKTQLQALLQEQTDLQPKLAECEEQWLEVTEALEAAGS